MANILTIDEATRVVMVDSMDEKLLDVLPQVDAYINEATGYDWTKDAVINSEAKAAARLYLALTYDLMAMQKSQIDALNRALISSLVRLEALAIELNMIKNINAVAYVEDLKAYLESDNLGLNLLAYNRLSYSEQLRVVQYVFDSKPYSDKQSIQTALDAAVKAVLPQ